MIVPMALLDSLNAVVFSVVVYYFSSLSALYAVHGFKYCD